MPFNSYIFPLFFVAVWMAYVCLRHRWQNLLLVAASYVFYGWWDWRFLSLLLISTLVDFHCARGIRQRPAHARKFLGVSLLVNLGILGFFKYFGFFAASAAHLLESLGLGADIPTLNLLLPVGISFYTFQTLGYTIDVYRGKETAVDDLATFALYVAYFPQLVAGPIERSSHLLPELSKRRRVSAEKIASGCELVLMGFFKKVFIADAVATMADASFAAPGGQSGWNLIIAVYFFALQIYGDFAGYTDIARGVSRLLGIELRLNFKQPYLATNITEFWRRWHMSLSSWLRDYLYIPLGGNRKGRFRTYLNNMLTMLLGGLWHGAGWNFIAWGGLHGMYLAVHKFTLGDKKVELSRPPRSPRQWVGALAGMFVTFHLVCLAWVFFRADSLSNAATYLGCIARGLTVAPETTYVAHLLFYGFWALLIEGLCWYRDDELPVSGSWRPLWRGLAYACMVFLIVCIGRSDARPFIYFQF